VGAFGNAVSYDAATDEYTFGKELNGGDILDPRIGGDFEYRNFSSNPLFAPGGPNRDDIDQGRVGDCWFLCALSGVAEDNPERIKNMVVGLGDGTFAVRFFRGGEERYYRVDADLAVFSEGGAAGMAAYAAPGTGNSIWAPIVEKAFVFARASAGHGWVIGPETIMLRNIYRPHYEVISGGWAIEAWAWMGVGSRATRDAGDFDDAWDMYRWVQSELDAGRTVTYSTVEDPDDMDLEGPHCYLVVGVQLNPDGQPFLVLRNPWATDGGRVQGPDDGYIGIHAHNAMDSMTRLQSAMA
jgi:hypothetical protein